MAETWIVYKAESMDAPNWEHRMLMPSEALTDVLHEEWDSSGRLPKLGDRVFEDKQDDDGTLWSREGDWVVSKIHQFSSFDTDARIVICYCAYTPIAPEWEKVERGAPVSEMMAAQTPA